MGSSWDIVVEACVSPVSGMDDVDGGVGERVVVGKCMVVVVGVGVWVDVGGDDNNSTIWICHLLRLQV
jgi:hypothetical protein